MFAHEMEEKKQVSVMGFLVIWMFTLIDQVRMVATNIWF